MTTWTTSLNEIRNPFTQNGFFIQIPHIDDITSFLKNDATQEIIGELAKPFKEAIQEIIKKDLITYIEAIQKIRSGEALKELEEYKEAIELFKEVIKIQPNNHKAWLMRSVCLMLLGEFERAENSFDRTLEKKRTFEPYYYKALMNLMQGSYEKALFNIDLALEFAECQLSEAWFDKAKILERLDRFDEAIDAYDVAIKLQPSNHAAIVNRSLLQESDDRQNIEGLLGRANALIIRQRANEALPYVDRIIEETPNNHEAWQLRGHLMRSTRNYAAAIHAYNKALSLNKSLRDSSYGLGVALYKTKKFRLASKALTIAIEQGYEHHKIWLYYGLAKYKLAHFRKALYGFSKLCETNPESILGHLLKAHTFRRRGDSKNALTDYHQVLKRKPNHIESLLCSAQIYMEYGNSEKALILYKKVWEINPNDRYSYQMIAHLEQELERRASRRREEEARYLRELEEEQHIMEMLEQQHMMEMLEQQSLVREQSTPEKPRRKLFWLF